MGLRYIDEEKQEAPQESSGRLHYVDEKQEVPREQKLRNTIGGLGAAGAGVSLAGLGAAGVKRFAEPFIDLGGVNKESNLMKSQLGLPNDLQTSDISKQIGFQKKLAVAPIKDKISNINLATKQSVSNANKLLNQFDSTIVNSGVEDIAQTMKSGYRPLMNSVYSNYGNGLKEIGSILKAGGMDGFDSHAYITKVIEPVIDKLLSSGVPEEKIGYLKRISEKLYPKDYKSEIVGGHPGGTVKEPPKLSVEQAKSYIDNVDDLRIKSSLMHKFGDFLEESAPTGSVAKTKLGELNQSYRPWAQLRNSIERTMEESSGEFKDDRIVKWFRDYIKTERDTSKAKVLEMMSEGTENVKPIPGLKGKAEDLEKAKIHRAKLKNRVPEIKMKSQEEIGALNKQLHAEVDRYTKLQQKAQELSSRRGTAVGRIKGRMIGTGVALGSGILKSLPQMMGMMAVTPNMTPKQIGNVSGVKMERPSFLDMASLVIPGMNKPKLTPEQEFQEALRAGLIA